MSNKTPSIGGQGWQRRQFFQIRTLRDRGHDLRVVTLAGPKDDSSLRGLGVTVQRAPELEWRGRLPRPRHRAALRRQLATGQEVVVVAHGESWERFEPFLPTDRPVLVDMRNVYRRSPFEDARQTARRARLETRIRDSVDAVCATSEREAHAMPHGQAPIVVAHNGVDPHEWDVEPTPASKSVVELFGFWSWAPNTRGLSWFVREVWPHVHRSTGATCEIAGGGVDPVIARTPGVITHGRASSLQEFLHDSWAVAVPLPESVGSPVKYPEALAVGCPVISTRQGAPSHRDLPVIVDQPSQWIETLTAWLGSSEPITPLVGAERTARLARLSWSATTEPIHAWVTSRGRT